MYLFNIFSKFKNLYVSTAEDDSMCITGKQFVVSIFIFWSNLKVKLICHQEFLWKHLPLLVIWNSVEIINHGQLIRLPLFHKSPKPVHKKTFKRIKNKIIIKKKTKSQIRLCGTFWMSYVKLQKISAHSSSPRSSILFSYLIFIGKLI